MRVFFLVILSWWSGVKVCAQYTLKDIPYPISEINKRDELGKKQGVWYFYNQYNIVHTMQHYKDDTLQGYFENYWFNNGIVSEKGYYKNGVLDSVMIAYWDNGQERGRANYKNGILDGVATSHDKNGNLTSRIRYVAGSRDSSYNDMYISPNIEWDNNAHPIKIDTIYTQTMNGRYEKYAVYKNDTLAHLSNFENGKKINESFYENAQEVKRIIYCTQKPYGVRKIFYYINGSLIRTDVINNKCK